MFRRLPAAIPPSRMAEMIEEIDIIRTQIHNGLWGVWAGLEDHPLRMRDVYSQILRLTDLDNLLDKFRAEIGGVAASRAAHESAPPPDRLN